MAYLVTDLFRKMNISKTAIETGILPQSGNC
jgi:hypothetical protein